jgi:hypothetical protein
MRLLFLSTACLGVACGGQATNDVGGGSEGDSADVSPAMLAPPPADDVLNEDDVEPALEDVDVAPEDQAPDLAERPSDSDPITDPSPDLMDPIEPLRATVQGCGTEVILGSCEDAAQIELRDISWAFSEGTLVVTGTAVGENNTYPCFGISPMSSGHNLGH